MASTTVTKRRQIMNSDMPLAEKLKHHYHTRDFSVRPGSASAAGLTVTAFMNLSLLFEGLVILLPTVYARNEDGTPRTGWLGEGYWTMLFLALFTWVEFTWTWWRVYFDVPNWVKKELKATHFGQSLETPPGWRNCLTCQLDAPPRSHHCSLCGHCILKQDHHCYFTGSCVGYYTQRHFVMFCVYAALAGALAIYCQLSYLNMYLPLPESFSTFIPPLPIYQLLIGEISFGTFLLLLHMYACVFILGAGVVFGVWQLFIISRGQTSYEAWKNIHVYDAGFFTNITTTFGSLKYAWILLFAPLLLPMDGDGTEYATKQKSDKGH